MYDVVVILNYCMSMLDTELLGTYVVNTFFIQYVAVLSFFRKTKLILRVIHQHKYHSLGRFTRTKQYVIFGLML